MKYSIIIPTYNHCDDLLKPCLESIIKYTNLNDVEIIIVANGCTDNTKEYLNTLDFKSIFVEESIGFVKATNIGMKKAKGDYIVLLNNDIELLEQYKSEWLDLLENPFKSNTKIGISGPKVMKHIKIDSIGVVFFCAMIKREVIDTIGFLDEIYSPGGVDDHDYSERTMNAGFELSDAGRIVSEYEKYFPILHKENQTFKENSSEYIKILQRNEKIFLSKYRNREILCSISTKNRYFTTLPTTLYSVLNQTLKPSKIVIFDDNDSPIDLRENETYMSLFKLMDIKQIQWEVIFGQKKGQHYNHQIANTMEYNWVWRVDDDVFPESNVLENLYKTAISEDNISSVGGSIICPNWNLNIYNPNNVSGKIEDIYSHQNIQWFMIKEKQEVDHLHCSFLYKAGITDYNLNLSRCAHREETLFTYQLKQKGYKNILIPNAISYHMKSETGGIRDNQAESYYHDEEIFKQLIDVGCLVVLDCGIGDHIVFASILNELIEKYKKITIACCYHEVFEDFENINYISLDNAKQLIKIDEYNIYKKMIDWNWTDSLQNAFRKLYE